MRDARRAALSVVATCVLLGLVARRLQMADVGTLVWQADLRWVALIVLLAPVQYALCGLRWHWVSEALGQPLPASIAVREVGLSTLLNQILPGGVVGDGIRIWRQAGEQALLDVARAAVIDRGIGIWVHAVFTLAGLLLAVAAAVATLQEAVVVVLIVLALTLVPLLRGRIGSDVRTVFVRAGGPVLASSGMLLVTLLVSFGAAGAAIGVAPGQWIPMAVPAILLAMAFPLSVGGWGLREATAVALLPRLGWTAEEALAASAVYGLSCLVGTLPGGAPLLAGGQQ